VVDGVVGDECRTRVDRPDVLRRDRVEIFDRRHVRIARIAHRRVDGDGDDQLVDGSLSFRSAKTTTALPSTSPRRRALKAALMSSMLQVETGGGRISPAAASSTAS